jgi:hypothetical protein
VAVDWTLDLIFPAETVQLGSGRAHPEEMNEADTGGEAEQFVASTSGRPNGHR